MYITIYDETDHQSKFDAWNEALKAGTLWVYQVDNPEGWDGEGGGSGVQDGEHMYTHGWFMSMYGKTPNNLVK